MNKPRVLILEDSDERIESFKKNFKNAELIFVKTVDSAKDKLMTEKWYALFLDHDLDGKAYVESGGSEPTGWDVARFLAVNSDLRPPHVVTHSVNPDGRKRIASMIQAQEIPFVWTMEIDFSTVDDG